MDSRDETVRFLRTLFAAGDVFEIRALEAVTAEYQRPHAESGYFDYDHIPQAAEAISKLRSYSGAYVTLNPVNPALLGRANNRGIRQVPRMRLRVPASRAQQPDGACLQ